VSVCVVVCVLSLVIRHANRLPHTMLSPVACFTLHVSTLSYKGRDFRKHVTENKMCVLSFSTNLIQNVSHFKN